MAKREVPYEEKKFLMEFLNLWRQYDRPPIHLYTDNLVSNDRGSGSISGLQHRFVAEAMDLADQLNVNVKLECLGISGICGDQPRSVMEAEGDEEDDDKDTVTEYGDEDDEEEEPTDYGAAEDDEGESTDEPAEDDAGGEDEGGGPEEQAGDETGGNEDNTDEDGSGEVDEEEDTATDYGEEDVGGDTDGDTEEGGGEDTATDYGEEAGGMEADGEGDDSEDNSDDSEDTSSDEQSNSSNTNILIKNFSLMRDFEKLYALITDNTNTLNSTLKADPGQNRVLVQVSRNLTSIKDFILTFIQFHFKNDNYQYNLYYYEVVVHLLKLNLKMLEKALTLGNSKKDNKKEVNKNG